MVSDEMYEAIVKLAEEAVVAAENAKAELERTVAEHTKFKEKIRDRMIKEADRRNWCSEFDGIIEEFGIRGRFANYAVHWRFVGTEAAGMGRYLNNRSTQLAVVDGLYVQHVIANSPEQARQLVHNNISRLYGTMFEIVKVEVAV